MVATEITPKGTSIALILWLARDRDRGGTGNGIAQ